LCVFVIAFERVMSTIYYLFIKFMLPTVILRKIQTGCLQHTNFSSMNLWVEIWKIWMAGQTRLDGQIAKFKFPITISKVISIGQSYNNFWFGVTWPTLVKLKKLY